MTGKEDLAIEDVASAWRMVRKELGKELFPGLVVVPHLQEAAFYDLMVLFTKCPTGILDKLAGLPAVHR